ncbi:hypothetical protein LX32DRAFT_260759 [Colletotrichum zoysiae]|uniref:Uncharacterized protein n=1 Tax=Colletotrichum zoysiae TaxID=1216348 RepID=A0AAD9LU61_9PEZI|nr:hypothetical protein LX32DRAFT_260759 [Colletotrichum zoysiae]
MSLSVSHGTYLHRRCPKGTGRRGIILTGSCMESSRWLASVENAMMKRVQFFFLVLFPCRGGTECKVARGYSRLGMRAERMGVGTKGSSAWWSELGRGSCTAESSSSSSERGILQLRGLIGRRRCGQGGRSRGRCKERGGTWTCSFGVRYKSEENTNQGLLH